MGKRQRPLEGLVTEHMLAFYKNKRVLVTGHTGFKGSWLCMLLLKAGAQVTGYALEPPTTPSLFEALELNQRMTSLIGDVRDLDALNRAFDLAQPEIVLHLAAQPIVRESYRAPVYTYDVNVMGTVNVLECVRTHDCVRSFLNVTTDKVYHNNEWEYGYRETDPLDGYDPYSNSKSCSELVTHSYKHSFFSDGQAAISTARAGNVIGGGDFAPDRIIPDCIRSALSGQPIIVRNPYSTRPYQHVLEPLMAYLTIARRQAEDIACADYYNVGPDDCDCVTTGTLADLFVHSWGDGLRWLDKSVAGPHEAQFLKLDCSRIKSRLGWKPTWHVAQAIEATVAWAKAYAAGEDIYAVTQRQIEDFLGEYANV